MNKKILILTSVYTAPDINISNNTNVVHYFAQEWVRKGYEVLVIHNYPVYMRVFHFVAKFAEKMIASKFNTSVTTVYQNNDHEYEMDGVKVVRMPLYKPLPRFAVTNKSMKRQINKIAVYCKSHSFIPDVITSHNYYPHMLMVNRLKELFFSQTKTCVVVHKQVWKMLKYCGEDYKTEINKVDIWGYRSLALKQEFEINTDTKPERFFMCYSGIPCHFLSYKNCCSVHKPIMRIVYVGSLIRRKYPEKLLLAIKESHLKDFRLDYVGDGVNRKIIEDIIAENHWEDNVILHGFVERKVVPDYIAKAQCFIMISEEETFGLVYLEAMSLGCITVASRGEGMDGIIEDGVNGFLCKAGDEHELAQIIDRINAMDNDELICISQKAYQTANKLTDEKVAERYINSILTSHISES